MTSLLNQTLGLGTTNICRDLGKFGSCFDAKTIGYCKDLFVTYSFD